jgi:NPCBM/NEW2 domain
MTGTVATIGGVVVALLAWLLPITTVSGETGRDAGRRPSTVPQGHSPAAQGQVKLIYDVADISGPWGIEPATVGGVTYNKALVATPYCNRTSAYLDVRLAGSYRRLTATVGVDPRGYLADVIKFVIWNGSQMLWSGTADGSDALPVDIPVIGVDMLQLAIQAPESWSDTCIHFGAVWANAKVYVN